MSLSSFSSLSSYSSESDLSTVFDIGLFKSSRARARRRRSSSSPAPAPGLTPTPKSASTRHKDDRRPTRSPSRGHTRRRRKRSGTPVSPRYDGALVPYALRSPGSRSGISYSDIDRWRAGTIGGSDFTYSSESSVTQSSVTSSVDSSSRTRSSRIDASSRRSTSCGSRQLKAPSIASQHPHPHPHPGIHHEPPRICEHCRTGFYPSSSRHRLDELIGICHAQQTDRHTKSTAARMCSRRSNSNLTPPSSPPTASLVSHVPTPSKGQRP